MATASATGSLSRRDLRKLFLTKGLRMFAYGFLSIALVLYLVQIGLSDIEVGLLLSLTLVGDTVISLILTTRADRYGRRNTLLIGAGLMLFASVLFVLTSNFVILLMAAIIGVISPSGNEVGPFLSVEQAALSQIVRRRKGRSCSPGTTSSARSRRHAARSSPVWSSSCFRSR